MRYAVLLMVFACSDPYAEDRAKLRSNDAELGRQLEELRASELATRAPACTRYLDTIAADRKARLACREPDMLQAFGVHQITLLHVNRLLAIQSPAELAAQCESVAKDLADDEKCER